MIVFFQIIVHMPNALKDLGLLIEAMTRARKTIICVTNPGSNFHELLKSAVNHNDARNCVFYREHHEHHGAYGTSCPFNGPTKILQKDEVRFSVEK